MTTLVRPRPNYYELLGLTPAATDEEIRQAFAREIGPSRPRPLGGTAEFSVAYATLHDPAKRRAYDDSLGLTPAPAKLQGWRYAGPVRVSRLGQPAVDREPKQTPQPATEVRTERQPTAFIAETPAGPEAELHVQVGRTRRSAPQSLPRPEPQNPAIRSRPLPMQARLLPMEDSQSEWKRPAMLVGALFAGVGLIGAALGWYASHDIGQAQAEVPKEVTVPKAAPPVAAEASVEAHAQPQPDRRPPSVAAPARSRRTPPPPKPAATVEQRAEDVPEISTEQVAALTSEAPDVEAAMPLSNAVVARTIRRIGYSCGEVVSTTAVEGAPGTFKVTCTSGGTYRAAPVHGRYRFRRW